MDRTSVKVLKYLDTKTDPVSYNIIVEKIGKDSPKSLTYLKSSGYISEGEELASISIDDLTGRATHNYRPNSMFEITSLGKDYLQHKPGNDFDRWLSRCSIIFSILGGALLSKPLWSIIEHLCEWMKQLMALMLNSL